jgi:hypothetical protein
MLSLVPNPETPLHRDGKHSQILLYKLTDSIAVVNMQAEIQQQVEMIRSMEEPPEPPFSGSRPYFSNLSLDNAPVSPQDDPRRATTMGVNTRRAFYRPPVRNDKVGVP